MTKQQQVKKDAPKAVELNEAALDKVAGGAIITTMGEPGIRDGTSNIILRK